MSIRSPLQSAMYWERMAVNAWGYFEIWLRKTLAQGIFWGYPWGTREVRWGGGVERRPPPTLYKGRTSIGHKIYLLLPFRTMHGGCMVGALTSFVGASRGGDALVYANPSWGGMCTACADLKTRSAGIYIYIYTFCHSLFVFLLFLSLLWIPPKH